MKKTRVLPMPKITFLYPLMITCFICSWMPEQNNLTSTVFLSVFILNLLVFVANFPDFKSFLLVIMLLFFGCILFLAKDFYTFFLKTISSLDPKVQETIAIFIVSMVMAYFISIELAVFYLAIGCLFVMAYVIIFILQVQIQITIHASSSFFYFIGVILAITILIATSYSFLCKSWILTLNENRIHSSNIFGETVMYEGDLHINYGKDCVLKYFLLRTGSVFFYIPSQDKVIGLYDTYFNKRYVGLNSSHFALL